MAVNLMVVGTEGKAVETEGYFISLNHTHTHTDTVLLGSGGKLTVLVRTCMFKVGKF